MAALLDTHRRGEAAATILTAELTDPGAYGRIVRDAEGRVQAIVEDAPGIRARLAAAGDDYELLFATPADAAETIATLSLRLGVRATRIGRIDVGTGVRLLNADGHQIPLEATGYRHF